MKKKLVVLLLLVGVLAIYEYTKSSAMKIGDLVTLSNTELDQQLQHFSPLEQQRIDFAFSECYIGAVEKMCQLTLKQAAARSFEIKKNK